MIHYLNDGFSVEYCYDPDDKDENYYTALINPVSNSFSRGKSYLQASKRAEAAALRFLAFKLEIESSGE